MGSVAVPELHALHTELSRAKMEGRSNIHRDLVDLVCSIFIFYGSFTDMVNNSY